MPSEGFCKITHWIRKKDPKFYETIEKLCIKRSFKPVGAGVTFLFPKQDVRTRIGAMANNAANMVEAARAIKAHLLFGYYPNESSFAGDVGSLLRIKLPVKTSGGKVTIGSATIAKAPGFICMYTDNPKMAVWEVVDGEIPMEGEEFKPPKSNRAHGKKKVGGTDPMHGGHPRWRLATKVESLYVEGYINNRLSLDGDPYLNYVVSLLSFLFARYPDLLLKLLPIIDPDPICSFYILLEPYKDVGEYLIPHDVLFGERGWNERMDNSDGISEYTQFFLPDGKYTSALRQSSSATIAGTDVKEVPMAFSQPEAIRIEVQSISDDIVGPGINAADLPKQIESAYIDFCTSNRVKALGPVLPDVILEALKGGRKLWQDEVRFIIHYWMSEIRSHKEKKTHIDKFHEMILWLRDHPGNNYATPMALYKDSASMEKLNKKAMDDVREKLRSSELSTTQVSFDLNHTERFYLLVMLVLSDDFLYIAKPFSLKDKTGGAKAIMHTYDVRTLKHLPTYASKVRALGGTPESTTSMPSEVLNQVAYYINRHGHLPKELQNLI